ncbi:Glutamate-gated chloride channel [Frankliniella fusca]|uniref:Glutamate-gated chloride channel n=1 Tax=Frankliniella fusca TaxID=407009 RepID=A0AAE1LSD3_9NEOP|nr:Glutamate-gated chloride channel [Frankliniella fusca]
MATGSNDGGAMDNRAITFPICVTFYCNQSKSGVQKVNFREKEKQVLDQILGRYDARIRPSGENGTDGPAIVRVNLFVRSIATISDIKMVSLGT